LYRNTTSKEVKKLSSEPEVIFVGMKPPMSYVLAIISVFSRSNVKEVTLKARGQAINTAVDAAEITRRKFMKELNVSKINIGTEEMPPREGQNRNRNISMIEITLTRQ
jgi:DNA-binding protein Alba